MGVLLGWLGDVLILGGLWAQQDKIRMSRAVLHTDN